MFLLVNEETEAPKHKVTCLRIYDPQAFEPELELIFDCLLELMFVGLLVFDLHCQHFFPSSGVAAP